MHIILRFIILTIKFIVDWIGDFLLNFGVVLWPLSEDSLTSVISKEAKMEYESHKYLRDSFQMFSNNLPLRTTFPATGRLFSRIWIKRLLELRVRINRSLKEDPSIYDVPLRRPVFIITLARTGSTFMHCLMAQDHRWRCPELWELEDCSPPPGEKDDKKRISESKLKWDLTSVFMGWNDVKNTHNFNVRTPEDLLFLYHCDFRFVQSALVFSSLEKDFTNYIRNPKWNEQVEFDENLRTRLKMICKNSDMENRRLLTMIHASSVNVPSLLKAFPDAQIITIHRDSVSTMKSACALIHCNIKACHRVFDSDKIGVGRRLLNYMKLDTQKLISMRKDDNLKAEGFQRFIDVHFKDLVKEPIKTMESVYKQLDIKFDEDVKRTMSAYLARHRNSTAKAKYTLEEYGLSDNVVKNAFNDYNNFFSVKA
ncbi:DgyrCDS12859 [Dimorphilus gyrociliatus]|uniref:DgyrCDS12859 n=1 Tax=Dimorphilus gyrociliatus TaxID=2664684 RepID=A0A7I8W8X6_9ANNE|nr:DgyrCDS12859 [Dimorphilus gyrociliatus]